MQYVEVTLLKKLQFIKTKTKENTDKHKDVMNSYIIYLKLK